MAGTIPGGQKAANTNREYYGEDFYSRIGRKGGLHKTPNGGFGSPEVGRDGLTGRQRARIVGVIGGRKGKRGIQQG